MKISLPHGTSKAEAIEKLKSGSSRLMERFGPRISDLQQRWEEDVLVFSFKTGGFSVSGSITVDTNNVELEAKLPLLARPFEGRIREEVTQATREIFES